MRITGARPAELAALVGVASVALMGAFVAPIYVGGWIDQLGLTATSAGLLVTVELLVAAISGLVLARWVGVLRPRPWLILGVMLVGVANLLCGFVTQLEWLLLCRTLVGIGAGMAYALLGAAVAGSTDPERVYAVISVFQGVLLALLLAGLPVAISQWGFGSVFVCMAAMCVAVAFLIIHWPVSTSQQHEKAGFPVSAAGVHLIVGVLLLAGVSMGIWSFSQQLGALSGLTDETIGVVLGVTTLAGLTGAVSAGFLGTRFGRALPLVVGVLLMTASMGALTGWHDGAVYAAAQCAWALSFYFVAPYILGLAATLDDTGQWAAATTGINSLGSAVGPVLFALVVGQTWTTTAVILMGLLGLGFLMLCESRTRALRKEKWAVST